MSIEEDLLKLINPMHSFFQSGSFIEFNAVNTSQPFGV